MSKPGLPQGTRDFGPEIVHKRHFIFHSIRTVFELFGYEPLETPAMENLDTLLGKYGEEGDKLLFKILNNGLDHPSKKDSAPAEFEKILAGKNNKHITERALRYDLTIPFARYVAMQHQQLSFPFKRYQLQPVWRADRPQKGRYREFYQCDADVVGSRSLLNEVELIQIYLSVFERLNLDVEIRINHRKILAGLAAASGGPDRLIPITTAIDKLDKIGLEKVKQELVEKNLSQDQIATIQRYLEIRSSGNEEKLMEVEKILGKEVFGTSINSPAEKPYEEEVGHSLLQGIQDIRKLLVFFPDSKNLVVDLSLARGLNYYTGIICDVRAKNVNIGSIGGGGRYDDLTGLFGVPGIPGVGISFGVDRIYDVMEELKLFPGTVSRSSEFLFFNLGTDSLTNNLALSQLLRNAGIRCELYPEQAKFDKQFKYAEKKKIPFVVLIGTEELKTGRAKIKNLSTGVQEECGFGEIVDYAKRTREG
jgi:histidyl-tRNA synthetase